jgi:peptidoglycan/xylan/chitin deacetylase (PgdA/CDA1 family)
MNKGVFIISLDFELRWGASEKWPVNKTKKKFQLTRESIVLILEAFERYNIAATWATVGFLFADNLKQLISYLPSEMPDYKNKGISAYNVLSDKEIGLNEDVDKSHFAKSIVNLIKDTDKQEVGSHSFSHYYADEIGAGIDSFSSDLNAAIRIADDDSLELKSFVFPRNQFSLKYVNVLSKYGFKSARSNPDTWVWKGIGLSTNKVISKILSLFRGVDTVLPISNTLFNPVDLTVRNGVMLIPASRFLRPYAKKEGVINRLKMFRIKNEMSKAAKEGLGYHLWWHPHNFSGDVAGNIKYLYEILEHYNKLHSKYKFQSVGMNDLVEIYSK